MRRLLLITFFTTSLLGCIGTAALWARSYRYLDFIDLPDHWGVCSGSGCLMVARVDFSQSHGFHGLQLHTDTEPEIEVPAIEFDTMELGSVRASWSDSFHWSIRRVARWDGTRYLYVDITFPQFVLVLFLAPGVVWPALHWWRRRRWRVRARHGYCVKCGYDLRASPERCPECGTPRVFVGHGEPT
ncbi:MAG: hypothetical protein ACE5I3_12485 [Phycisphaerae bacterium]